MMVTVEISYYPFDTQKTYYQDVIQQFIDELLEHKDQLKIEVRPLSTQVVGDYVMVMDTLRDLMGKYFRKYDAIFTLRVANACPEDVKQGS